MNQTNGTTTSASQANLAAVIHQTSIHETRLIAQVINAFAHSRSACIQRRQWLRAQIAKIDAALESQPAKPTVQRCRKLPYGELTAALKEVLQSGALPKREIVARLREKNFLHKPHPLKTLDSVLYTPHFKRDGKLFSLATAQP